MLPAAAASPGPWSGVRVLRQQNRGLSAARNAGTHATAARYVFPLDADDLVAPGALTSLADALDARPEHVAAWGRTHHFGELSFSQRRARSLDPWSVTYVNELDYAALFRRHELAEAGQWVLEGGYEDWDLWMSFAEAGHRGLYVDVPVLRKRMGPGRMLGDSRRIHDQLWSQLRRRHQALFTARRMNRRRSPASLYQKLVFPVMDALPVSSLLRHRLLIFAANPSHGLRVRGQRIRARLSQR